MTPIIDRRSFLGSLGAAAVASALPRHLKAALVPGSAPQTRPVPRVAVLTERGFPTLDAPPLDERTLRAALDGLELTRLPVANLAHLTADEFDAFVSPYGSAFPKDAWPAIHAFLAGGGNWVNLGGVPLAVPVRREGSAWRAEVRQTAYHKTLGITQAYPVRLPNAPTLEANPELEWTGALAHGLHASTVYELYYRFTREREFPEEDGSSGPRDAVITPLLAVAGGDHALAVPVVRIDRLLGPFASGRWILVNGDVALTPRAIRALVEHAALGANQLTALPSLACYHDGERPGVTVTLKSPGARQTADASCHIEVFDDAGMAVAAGTVPFTGAGFVRAATATLDAPAGTTRSARAEQEAPAGATRSATSTLQAPAGATLAPGLYRVEAAVESQDPAVAGLRTTTGFWIFDEALLAGGRTFTTDEYHLLRDGAPYIVTGTSYMPSDVQRKFLLEPNPWLWDRELAAMKGAGINMVRTGIWTGWKNYMLDVSAPNEVALRALDAFLLAARRHDIPVIFTFFAFLPEMWGGANPYLDPRAVAAQKTFVALIARRYRAMNDVIWDLINEPSFSSPAQLWLVRPNYDEHEARAWRDWLGVRYPAASEAERAQRLAELWRTLPDDALALPRLDEFGDRNIFDERRPLKVWEYRLFAQEMFTRWARELAATLREAANPRQLVTVGQDEGGTYERPSPMFYAPAVDFTSNHTWWNNDDLLWDSVVTKTPDRPNLIEETGVMFYERLDGSAWRTEEEARDLLERKLVLALAAGGAGFIQWCWSTNPYMPSDNEAAIGLLRPDGSAKPELEVVRGVAAFVREQMRDLGSREPEPVLMVIPHSNMFSVRNQATEATRRAVRAMCYGCGMAMSAASEYALDRLVHEPRLIVLPSPRVLTQAAWEHLVARAEAGATLVVSGPIDFDEYWRPAVRLERFGLHAGLRPVAQEELLDIDGTIQRLSFRGEKIQRVETAVREESEGGERSERTEGGEGSASEVGESLESREASKMSEGHAVVTVPVGRGRLIWSPLPVELAHEVEPTVALYRYALQQAGVASQFSVERADPGVLIYPALYRAAVLYGIVSELGSPTTARFVHTETGTPAEITLPAGRAALALVSRGDGRMVGAYGGTRAP